MEHVFLILFILLIVMICAISMKIMRSTRSHSEVYIERQDGFSHASLSRSEECSKERERIFRAINSLSCRNGDDSYIDAQIKMSSQITKHLKEYQDVYTPKNVVKMPKLLPDNVVPIKAKD